MHPIRRILNSYTFYVALHDSTRESKLTISILKLFDESKKTLLLYYDIITQPSFYADLPSEMNRLYIIKGIILLT